MQSAVQFRNEPQSERGRFALRAREIVNLLEDWPRVQPLWDEYVESHPKGSIFHTSAMVRVYAGTKGNKPIALASIGPDGEVDALLVSVRVQTLPGPLGRLSSRSVFYAEPLCRDDAESRNALSQLLVRHDAIAGRSVLFAEVRPLFASGCERAVLEHAGYQYLDYLNILNDVGRSADEMWPQLHRAARRAVRQCESRGLTVREVPAETAVDKLYPLLQQSYAHSGVPLADRSLFDASVRELYPERIRFFAVFEGATPVAMDAMLTYKDRIYFWYGGLMRSAPGSPCSQLRWHELKWAHENGYLICDSGGAGWPGVPYGVRDFKKKFGGELVQFGRYRKVFAPWKLAAAEQVYKLRRALVKQK
jgi:hypothetical protein